MAARYDWETIRAEYEAGATMGELSRKHGVSKPTISVRARKEGWTRDVSGAIDRMATAKANGVTNTVSPQKKAAAVDAAAERKAAVIREQREAWDGFKAEVKKALEGNDFDRLKCLKIASETLRNAQECERKAWGIQDKTGVDLTSSDGSMSPTQDRFNLALLTPEQLKALRGLTDEDTV